MLDLYLIKDDMSKPNNSKKNGLLYVGEVDYNCFDSLIKNKVIDNRFDFYSDFRWNLEMVKQIYGKIKLNQIHNTITLIEILDNAIKNNSGLVAYCD